MDSIVHVVELSQVVSLCVYWQLANQLAPSRHPVYWTLYILKLAQAQNDITHAKVDQLGRKNGGAVGTWL